MTRDLERLPLLLFVLLRAAADGAQNRKKKLFGDAPGPGQGREPLAIPPLGQIGLIFLRQE